MEPPDAQPNPKPQSGSLAYHRAWRLANRERLKAQRIARYWADPELARARAKAYREAHPERSKASQRRYLEKNRELVEARRQAYRRSNAGISGQRKWLLKSKYGMSQETFKEMEAAQGGVCAICGSPPPPDKTLHVDHDHETGAIRALLCRKCNNGLAGFRDNPALMLAAIEYLRSSKE